jgi:hypothetical protein
MGAEMIFDTYDKLAYDLALRKQGIPVPRDAPA